MEKVLYDTVVIGGGPAGLTAALYLARARRRVLVLEKERFGGQISITSEVVNYPGVEKASGADLAKTMRRQAESFGAEMLVAEVESLDLEGDVKHVHTNRGDIDCLSILLATGAVARKAGFKGEDEFRGHGVAYCATCDGEFFDGREVFVVGGGYAAAEEAVFLAKYASHVTMLIRGADFSCAPAIADEARNHEKIDVHTRARLLEVSGDSAIRRVLWHDDESGEDHEFKTEGDDFAGVFVFAGYSPSTDLVKGKANLDERGYVVTDEHQMTSVPGLFAAGDVCQKQLRQVVTAVGEAAATATEIDRFVKALGERTGLVATPVDASPAAKKSKPTSAKDTGSSSGSSPFDDAAREQLEAVFSRMQEALVLRVHDDGGALGKELVGYLEALASLTDLITVERVEGNASSAEPAYVEVLRSDGTPSGLEFHGVPGGHEFTSFVLGLYNVSGPGQPLSDEDKAGISAIDRDVAIRIIVSLSCTMCPDLVVAAQRIAADNPHVTAHVYDVAKFPELKERYNVMSVPCLIVDDDSGERVEFGRKNLGQLLEYLG